MLQVEGKEAHVGVLECHLCVCVSVCLCLCVYLCVRARVRARMRVCVYWPMAVRSCAQAGVSPCWELAPIPCADYLPLMLRFIKARLLLLRHNPSALRANTTEAA